MDQLAVRDRADVRLPRHGIADGHRRGHGPRGPAGLRISRPSIFFFTAPIRKRDYLGGRFVGAVAVLLVFLSEHPARQLARHCSCPASIPIASGRSRLAAYVVPYATMLLPNLVVLGGLFFCLAALTRRMLPVYIASVLLLVGYLAAQGLLRDIDNKTLAALLDPFGITANAKLTEYWTIAERNTRLVPFEGVLLWNRLLWLASARPSSASAARASRFAHAGSSARVARARRRRVAGPPLSTRDRRRASRLASSQRRSRAWRLLPRMTWLNFRETVKNIYFGVIALAGVLFCVTTSTTSGSIFGTTTWPVTYQMLELVSGTFACSCW